MLHACIVAGLGIAVVFAVQVLINLERQPTVQIAGATGSGKASANEFDHAYVESFANDWLIRLYNTNAYNYPTQAAVCLKSLDDTIVRDALNDFIETSKTYSGLEMSQEARVTNLVVVSHGADHWRVTFDLVTRTYFGDVPGIPLNQKGSMDISSRMPRPGERYALVINDITISKSDDSTTASSGAD